jgi:hypothetical protein
MIVDDNTFVKVSTIAKSGGVWTGIIGPCERLVSSRRNW